MQDKKISIIIPVKNNENEIENCVKELIKIKNVNNFRNFEILFVDDFSNDNSWNVIIRETYKFSKLVKGIKLKRNYGQQLASYVGMKFASNSDLVITMDCDLEDNPENIPNLIDKIIKNDHDFVVAISSFEGNFLYKFFSRIYYFLMGTFSYVKEISRHTNLRVYKKSCINSLLRLNPTFFHLTHSPIHIQSKIGYLTIKKKYKKRESSYSLFSKIKIAIFTLFDLSNFITSIFIFLLIVVVFFLLSYYIYSFYIYAKYGILSGFFPLITFLLAILFSVLISFFYLNHKMTKFVDFFYKGIDCKIYENYFEITDQIGFD